MKFFLPPRLAVTPSGIIHRIPEYPPLKPNLRRKAQLSRMHRGLSSCTCSTTNQALSQSRPLRRDFKQAGVACEAALSLCKLVRRKRDEGSAHERYLSMLEREIEQLRAMLPKASVPAPKAIPPKAPRLDEITEEVLVNNLSCDATLSVQNPGKWIRFIWDDNATSPPIGYTHKIMPGLFRILASDGIRALVCPYGLFGGENATQVIVHCTNLIKHYDPEDESKKEKQKQFSKHIKALHEYSIDDLV